MGRRFHLVSFSKTIAFHITLLGYPEAQARHCFASKNCLSITGEMPPNGLNYERSFAVNLSYYTQYLWLKVNCDLCLGQKVYIDANP